MNRATNLLVLLIVISFIFPATVIRYAQAASATPAASKENNATASANMTVNPGPIVPTPKENTTSPTYGCQWPIPTGEGLRSKLWYHGCAVKLLFLPTGMTHRKVYS